MSIAPEIAKSMATSPEPESGASGLLAQITPAVYADLRRLARCFMRGERGGHTLQPTAVVNEAYLRLSRSEIEPKDALHLVRLVAQTMRRVLVDHARERKRLKRSPTHCETDTSSITDQYSLAQSDAPLDVLDIDAALNELAHKASRAAALLELRYFAGLDDVEISELCGISRATVEREFRFAKAFLIAYARRQRLPLSDAPGAAARV